MRGKNLPVLLVIVLISSCHVFLGPDPDNSPKGIFDSIWNDFNETYALFDVKGIDWNEVYKIYSPGIQPDMNSFRLFRICEEMLNELNDPHVNLISPFNDLSEKEPFNLEYVKNKLKDGGALAGDSMFFYGTFQEKPNVGYIYIKGFRFGKENSTLDPIQSWAKKIDGILQSLARTDSVILDIRDNGGGSVANAEYIAGRFAAVQKDYIKVSTKNGPGRNDFSTPVPFTIRPAGQKYTKPVVLLTNNQTVSAAEWLTLALRTQNHVTHAGEATRGGFSIMIRRPLINGWEYTMSIQKVTDVEGNCYEGIGITPDEEHIVAGHDTQLDYALSFFD